MDMVSITGIMAMELAAVSPVDLTGISSPDNSQRGKNRLAG